MQPYDSVPPSSHESSEPLSSPAEPFPSPGDATQANKKASKNKDNLLCESSDAVGDFIKLPGVIMYKPNLVRFHIVREVIASPRKTNSKSVKVAAVVSAANKHRELADAPLSSTGDENDTPKSKPFDAQEIVGHLNALEIENHIVFARRQGVVHFL